MTNIQGELQNHSSERFMLSAWKTFTLEEKGYFNHMIMKSNQLKNNIISDEEKDLILERIGEELESEAKYE